MRLVAVLLAGLGVVVAPAAVSAQSTAVPPDRAALDRVNLAAEWATAIPLAHRGDGLAMVQVADGDQVFAQTRGGTLVALDARSGALQWQLRYDAANAPVLPVAVTDRHVLAVNVITLYVIQRYSGQIDLQYNLPLTPTAPPAADQGSVFVVLNGQRLAAFELPLAVRMPDRDLVRADAARRGGAGDPRAMNPADVVAARYPAPGRAIPPADPVFDARRVRVTAEAGAGLGSLQRTPSLGVSASVLPPYHAFDEDGKYIHRIESLNITGSLRQPYTQNSPTGQVQRTPSLAAIPPSVAAAYERAVLRGQGVEPALRWVYGSTVRLGFQPLITRLRVWAVSEGAEATALLRKDSTPQVVGRFPAAPAAPPAQAEDIAYIPLADGSLIAVDLTAGGGAAVGLVWRANVGGLMNQKPVATADSVYMPGDFSGVARVDRKTGDLTWRTEPTADRLAAVNNEHVYVRDRQGRLSVYDRGRVTDLQSRRAVKLGTLNVPAFGLHVENDRTDRVYLAAETGVIVCLRDTNPVYAVPMAVAPPPRTPVVDPKKPADPVAPPPAAGENN